MRSERKKERREFYQLILDVLAVLEVMDLMTDKMIRTLSLRNAKRAGQRLYDLHHYHDHFRGDSLHY